MPMPRHVRRARPLLAALVAAGLIALTACSSDPSGSPGAQGPTGGPGGAAASSKPRWEACGGGLECAKLPVPVDHAKPDGEMIELALIRAPARYPFKRIGSLIVNPGGPGGSGVEFVRTASATGRFGIPVRNRFDIVGFDPRGVGESAPVRCITDQDKDRMVATGHLVPANPGERDELLALARGFAQGCERSSRTLLPHMSTEASARDLDLLRAALGDEKLTYFGFSYGTLLGATYASLFPTHVRAMALDGAVDPDIWFNRPQELERQQAQAFEKALDIFLRVCKANAECGFGGKDPAAAYDRLIKRLDEQPIQAVSSGDPRPVNGSVAFGAVTTALYSPFALDALAQALRSADKDNDGSELLALYDAGSDRQPNGTYSNSDDAQASTSCVDGIHPTDTAAYERLSEELGRDNPRFGAVFGLSSLPCAFWPVKAASRYPGPFRAEGAPPILVIGTLGDPAAPYPGAEALADSLASGVLLTFESFGHGAYGGLSECVNDTVNAYLVDLKAPEDGATCEPPRAPA